VKRTTTANYFAHPHSKFFTDKDAGAIFEDETGVARYIGYANLMRNENYIYIDADTLMLPEDIKNFKAFPPAFSLVLPGQPPTRLATILDSALSKGRFQIEANDLKAFLRAMHRKLEVFVPVLFVFVSGENVRLCVGYDPQKETHDVSETV
jgi:hypothetical protein